MKPLPKEKPDRPTPEKRGPRRAKKYRLWAYGRFPFDRKSRWVHIGWYATKSSAMQATKGSYFGFFVRHSGAHMKDLAYVQGPDDPHPDDSPTDPKKHDPSYR